jgi:CRISPR/Cas system endoribonuclease Cas6 (RAMP superfamily)
VARAGALPRDTLPVTFLTPTRLKHHGSLVWEGPPFHVLIKALLGRVSSLSYFHCGERWRTDFRGWIDRAKAVELSSVETTWDDWQRRSGRQDRWIWMGGLTGRATYAGALAPFLPLLALGEAVQVGKKTVFGDGWYEIQLDGSGS